MGNIISINISYDVFTNHNFLIFCLIFLIVEIVIIIALVSVFFKKRIKKTEELQIETYKRFKNYLDYSPIGIFVVNIDMKLIDVNQAACDITGYCKDELTTMNMLQLQTKNIANKEIAISKLMDAKETLRQDINLVRKDCTEIWTEINVVKISENEFLCYVANIEERKKSEIRILQQTEELQQRIAAKAHAEESDRLKTSFLQNMSHEIRTPLNAIMGFSQILPDFYNDKDSIKKFSGIIRSRSEDLMSILNDVLDIAKIESGQIDEVKEPCTIEKIFIHLSENFNMIKKRLEKDNIEIIFNADEELKPQRLFIDYNKMIQVYSNLIHNAIKFTQIGSVVVAAKIENGYLICSVEDTGTGISEEFSHIIFDRFVQVEKNIKNNNGTGLGLAIVKGLLKTMNGTIQLESELGRGSKFIFQVPI